MFGHEELPKQPSDNHKAGALDKSNIDKAALNKNHSSAKLNSDTALQKPSADLHDFAAIMRSAYGRAKSDILGAITHRVNEILMELTLLKIAIKKKRQKVTVKSSRGLQHADREVSTTKELIPPVARVAILTTELNSLRQQVDQLLDERQALEDEYAFYKNRGAEDFNYFLWNTIPRPVPGQSLIERLAKMLNVNPSEVPELIKYIEQHEYDQIQAIDAEIHMMQISPASPAHMQEKAEQRLVLKLQPTMNSGFLLLQLMERMIRSANPNLSANEIRQQARDIMQQHFTSDLLNQAHVRLQRCRESTPAPVLQNIITCKGTTMLDLKVAQCQRIGGQLEQVRTQIKTKQANIEHIEQQLKAFGVKIAPTQGAAPEHTQVARSEQQANLAVKPSQEESNHRFTPFSTKPVPKGYKGT